jgi:hypothetical protein
MTQIEIMNNIYKEYIKTYMKMCDKYVWELNEIPQRCLQETDILNIFENNKNDKYNIFLTKEYNRINNINDNEYSFVLPLYLQYNEIVELKHMEDILLLLYYFPNINAYVFYTTELSSKLEFLIKNKNIFFIKKSINYYMINQIGQEV